MSGVLAALAATALPATGGGGSAHQYWRLNISAAQSGAFVSIDEIEMRASVSGADQCSGGTANADSAFGGLGGSYAPTRAFDNNTASAFPWASGSGFPHWISYAFAAPVVVAEVAVRTATGAYGGPSEYPKDFTIEWSDDNSAWTVARAVTGQTGWTSSETRTFTVP